ncbi:hypothetical protein CRM22_008904 [Opisthorchis felineus]|uniref:Tetratricopeptide repeat protein 39B n=1 Tax=Opisthorchis felineus TaxID=147828 RepID=A0A4S2L9V1_OPIFE|nr:hypothetical protein CRM22_008904 [Opisthorchis felineus]
MIQKPAVNTNFRGGVSRGRNKMEHLTLATEHIRRTLAACNTNRRKSAFAEIFTKQLPKKRIAIYKEYTEEQAHAELCYAEALLQLAFLNMLQDDKFTSLIRSSLKVRQCYKCYRICWGILKYRDWSNGISKAVFESGVRLGVGAFNMMISLLPKRVLKLLEFVGFSGDRLFGLQQLRLGAQIQNSLRAPLSALLLLVYELYATQMLGDTVASVAFEKPDQVYEANELLTYWLDIYPQSAVFQLLLGRYQAITGDLERAIDTFEKATTLPVDWKHYNHMCYWELLWCYALRADWLTAIKYVDKLATESLWSQATYRYMKATFLIQILDEYDVSVRPGTGSKAKQQQQQQLAQLQQKQLGPYKDREAVLKDVDLLLKDIPKMMHRFAGRSLPLEKIALRKSKRYFNQNKKLTLPALELMFIWNEFKLIHCQQDSIMSFLLICENKINDLIRNRGQYQNFDDDYSLALLLKGVCLRCRGQLFQASMCFQEILELKQKITIDTYLLPYCEMELCQLALDAGDIPEAIKRLQRARNSKNYSLESRLHFRMHEMDTRLEDYNHKTGKLIKKAGSETVIPGHKRSDSHSNSSICSTSKEEQRGDSESEVDITELKPMFPEFEEEEEFGGLNGVFAAEETFDP